MRGRVDSDVVESDSDELELGIGGEEEVDGESGEEEERD